MNIREMHYDFKKKFNKIDSQKNRNLLVPEIDWSLNEALDLFIKLAGSPRLKNGLGFEVNQIAREDLKNLVKTESLVPIANIVTLPTDYRYWIRGKAIISKGNCLNQTARIIVQEHDDLFEESHFYNSSFEWREVHALFNDQGILLTTDNTFNVNSVSLSYLKVHPLMHNAQDYQGGSYLHPSGVTLTGSQDCILSEHTHRTIVDIAVKLAAGEIQASDFNLKAEKLSFNQIV
jgi:hypothetical protein